MHAPHRAAGHRLLPAERAASETGRPRRPIAIAMAHRRRRGNRRQIATDVVREIAAATGGDLNDTQSQSAASRSTLPDLDIRPACPLCQRSRRRPAAPSGAQPACHAWCSGADRRCRASATGADCLRGARPAAGPHDAGDQAGLRSVATGYSSITPPRSPFATASARLVASSLANSASRWNFTVCTEMPSCRAAALLLIP